MRLAIVVPSILVAILLASAANRAYADPLGNQCTRPEQTAAMFQVTTAQAAAVTTLTAAERDAIRAEIRSNGWPAAKLLGRDRIDALVRMIDAQTDVVFFEKMAIAMSNCAGSELNRHYVAAMIDRHRLAAGQPQQYGMVYEFKRGVAAVQEPLDPQVERWRASLFLVPLAEQTARVNRALRDGQDVSDALALPSRPTVEPPTNPSLRERLLVMGTADQAAEVAFLRERASGNPDASAHLGSQQHTQTKAAKKLLANGLVDARAVGYDAVDAEFLLVQHADDNAWFDEQVPRLKTLMQRESLSREAYALAIDRMRVHHHQPQLYGSQFQPSAPGAPLVPYPIVDPAHLDERRAAMGMEPFETYRKSLGGEPIATPVATSPQH